MYLFSKKLENAEIYWYIRGLSIAVKEFWKLALPESEH